MGHAAVVIGGAEVRIELDGLVEVLEGVLVVVEAEIAEAARVIGCRVLRIELDGAREVGDARLL